MACGNASPADFCYHKNVRACRTRSDMQPGNLKNRNRDLLREMLQRPEEQICLAEGALLIAANEYPDLDPAKYLDRLDIMARNVGPGGGADPLETIARINHYLYEEEGFSGNSEDYYDPRNSFLNEVLDRKTGIPITLSTIYLEIANRLKLPLVGVGLPGHFLIKHRYFGILIDPFAKGRIVTESDCREQMQKLMGESVPFHRMYLEGVSKRHIISRMLNNLRTVYINSCQFYKALAISDMAVTVQPDSPYELKQRAALLIHLHRHSDALKDLNRYLELEPEAEDAKDISKIVLDLRKTLAQLN